MKLPDIARLHQRCFPLGPPLGAALRRAPPQLPLASSFPRARAYTRTWCSSCSSSPPTLPRATSPMRPAPSAPISPPPTSAPTRSSSPPLRGHARPPILSLRAHAVDSAPAPTSSPPSSPPAPASRPSGAARSTRAPPRPCLYTRLIDAHTKGRDMAASRKVFDGMLCPGVASRNALLISYAKNKMYLKALSVFREVAGQG